MTQNNQLGHEKSLIQTSAFESAMHKLSLNTVEQQKALLQILQLDDLLTSNELWESLYILNTLYPFAGNYISAFHKINDAINTSKANTNDYRQFKVDILFNKLKEITELNDQDFLRFIVYTSQSTFDRKVGQERDQLPVTKYNQWSKDRIKLFVELSHQLGSVSNHFQPKYQDYDVCAILGTSMASMYSRIMHFKFLSLLNNHKFREVFMLVGDRELCLNLDQISKKFEDEVAGIYTANTHLKNNIITTNTTSATNDEQTIDYSKEIIVAIAEQNNIALGTPQFVTNSHGRTIPNYINKAQIGTITETLAAKYYLKQLNIDNQVQIVTTPMQNGTRPTTVTTVETFAHEFINNIKHNKYGKQTKFRFLIVSNDPYTNRQLVSFKRVMQYMLKDAGIDQKYNIEYEAVASPSSLKVSRVSSANAAYILELYQMAIDESPVHQQGGNNYDYPSTKLQYQYRSQHHNSLQQQIPPMPKANNSSFHDVGLVGGVAAIACLLGLVYAKFCR